MKTNIIDDEFCSYLVEDSGFDGIFEFPIIHNQKTLEFLKK